jgi:hypothetical protein
MRHLECVAMQLCVTQEAPEMRFRVEGLLRTIKREHTIRFGHEQLTSYGRLDCCVAIFKESTLLCQPHP